ncbi:hypothetical protein PanABDRAFT_3418 [Pantoea sp. aB]|jgi:hypothetical protein|nr:hypothetical protein PanABDRAFT_3418 [Pantoea sp. aB]
MRKILQIRRNALQDQNAVQMQNQRFRSENLA